MALSNFFSKLGGLLHRGRHKEQKIDVVLFSDEMLMRLAFDDWKEYERVLTEKNGVILTKTAKRYSVSLFATAYRMCYENIIKAIEGQIYIDDKFNFKE